MTTRECHLCGAQTGDGAYACAPCAGTLRAEAAARASDVTADLLWAADRWPDLVQARIPGTGRQRRSGLLSAAARAEADALARLERAERDDDAPGETPAPVDVDVLDLLTTVLIDAHALADRIVEIAQAEVLPPPSTAFASAVPYLRHTVTHLAAAAEADPEALDDAAEVARRIRRAMEDALGELTDGQVLSAVCAWCRGVDAEHPAGGLRSLTVRLVAGEPLLVCMNYGCNPPEADCGTWVGTQPAWREAEWEWLSRRLDASA